MIFEKEKCISLYTNQNLGNYISTVGEHNMLIDLCQNIYCFIYFLLIE